MLKLSESWIREWVDPSIDFNQLLDQMASIGFEISNVQRVCLNINGVIVGEIVDCIDFSYSKKILKVDVGINNIDVISFSDKNCDIGSKIAVAMPYSNISYDVKSKPIILCNDKIVGFACTYFMLLISRDTNIINFPPYAKIGDKIEKYFNFNDNTFIVNFPKFRSDYLSVYGISREIAAINDISINCSNLNFDVNWLNIEKNINFSVYIENNYNCPRYLCRIIKGINISCGTPEWIKKRLFFSGIKSINPIADIVNYVFIELAQPIYVYDLDKINNFISVRMAKNGEKIYLNNELEIKLNENTLVVSDEKNILSMAGILYSSCACINNNTKNIFIECAFFNPDTISYMEKLYSVCTETSIAFSHGVDPYLQFKSINRITNLIVNAFGGSCGNLMDFTSVNNLPNITKIQLNKSKIDKLIGISISQTTIVNILNSLGFKVSFKDNFFIVIVPSWRFDICCSEDLIEEIVRFYGYHNIIATRDNYVCYENINNYYSCSVIHDIKTLLVNRGYNEVINYSFTNKKIYNLFSCKSNFLSLLNPISNEMSVMRTTLIGGLLCNLIYNQRRQQKNFKLFECGSIYLPDSRIKENICEKFFIGGIVSGSKYLDHWIDKKRNFDFFDVKGDVVGILRLTGKYREFLFEKKRFCFLNPLQSSGIYFNKKIIGYIGRMHPNIIYDLDLNINTFVFEIDCKIFSKCILPKISDVSIFPISKRDISILVPKDLNFNDILLSIKNVDINHIQHINLFDVFYSKSLKKGYKSLSISLFIQDKYRSLTDQEIEIVVDKCILHLKNKFNCIIRGVDGGVG